MSIPSCNERSSRESCAVSQRVLKKTQDGDVETRIYRILLQYRTTPHKTREVSPAELLMKRKLTTRFSRVHPDLQQRLYDKQVVTKERQDQHEKQSEFVEGGLVFEHTFNTQEK